MKLNFKTSEVPQETGFQPIPKGRYEVVVDRMEPKATKSGGTMLSTAYQVVDGKYKGRLIFENINIENKNNVAERIGRARLRDIGLACGITDVEDTDDLKHTPFDIEVDVEYSDYRKENENVVKKIYFDKNDDLVGVKQGVVNKMRDAEPASVGADDDIPF